MKARHSKSTRTQSLATVSASLAATVAGTHAATVQITLTGNRLTNSLTNANTLNPDLTGDASNDILITNAAVGFGGSNSAFCWVNGGALRVQYTSSNHGFVADAKFAAAGVGEGELTGTAPRNAKYLNPITFTDARINGGASTQGYLEVNAFNSSTSSQTIALTRLVFDDSSTTLGTGGLSTLATYTEWTPAVVPEPSSLALLALGAGGLAVRRRRQVA